VNRSLNFRSSKVEIDFARDMEIVALINESFKTDGARVQSERLARQ
jgi:hypothetical protein